MQCVQAMNLWKIPSLIFEEILVLEEVHPWSISIPYYVSSAIFVLSMQIHQIEVNNENTDKI